MAKENSSGEKNYTNKDSKVFSIFFVGAFLEQSSQQLQWLVFFFFRQTPELTLYVPLFSTDFNRFRGNPALAGSSRCLSQKRFRAFAKPDETEGTPCQFFLALCDFFSNIFVFKSSPFILQQTGISKSQKGLTFYNFRH